MMFYSLSMEDINKTTVKIKGIQMTFKGLFSFDNNLLQRKMPTNQFHQQYLL